MQINIKDLIDDNRCCETVRRLRRPDGAECPFCRSGHIVKRGTDDKEPARQRYECRNCGRRFDDLSETVFAGRHQSLKMRILSLCFMGLNLSNEQISGELSLNSSDVRKMTARLREGMAEKKPGVKISGEVECDEVYIIAGHKGSPDAVRKKGREGRGNRLKGQRGRGTLEKEKPPVFGMTERCGRVVIQMPENVRQKTIEPLIKDTILPGTLIYTDEYNIHGRLSEWGYGHKSVNHGAGEYAGDEDGDGFCEVHVNTMEGFWSLLRSRLRPHRGVSQEKLPLYPGFFEFVHNVRKRGKALLHSLVGLLVR